MRRSSPAAILIAAAATALMRGARGSLVEMERVDLDPAPRSAAAVYRSVVRKYDASLYTTAAPTATPEVESVEEHLEHRLEAAQSRGFRRAETDEIPFYHRFTAEQLRQLVEEHEAVEEAAKSGRALRRSYSNIIPEVQRTPKPLPRDFPYFFYGPDGELWTGGGDGTSSKRMFDVGDEEGETAAAGAAGNSTTVGVGRRLGTKAKRTLLYDFTQVLRNFRCTEECCRTVPACLKTGLEYYEECRSQLLLTCYVDSEWDWTFWGKGWFLQWVLGSARVKLWVGFDMRLFREGYAYPIGTTNITNLRTCPKSLGRFVNSEWDLVPHFDIGDLRKWFWWQGEGQDVSRPHELRIDAAHFQATANYLAIATVDEFKGQMYPGVMNECLMLADDALTLVTRVARRSYGYIDPNLNPGPPTSTEPAGKGATPAAGASIIALAVALAVVTST